MLKMARILTRSPMEILVEPSEYRFLNAGDSAMTQVAISRLRSMWPEAEIRVLTSHPELLPAYSPRVSPLANTGRLLWLGENLFPVPLARARCKSWSRMLSIRLTQGYSEVNFFMIRFFSGI
jgi:hypothetical protein